VVGFIKGKSAIHLARVYGEKRRNFVGHNSRGSCSPEEAGVKLGVSLNRRIALQNQNLLLMEQKLKKLNKRRC
jgi:hypothetical protein